jgi:glycosyltransferase involved in cell wall biosynthesis
MSRRRYDVCAAVVSDLAFDARVWKEVRSLGARGYSIALIGCAYEIQGTHRRRVDGTDVIEVPLGSRGGSISLMRRAITLARLWLIIMRTPARAYHAHNIHTGPPSWVASRLRRAALVYDAHELYGEMAGFGPLNRIFARLNMALERFMVRRSDAVITTNPSRAEILKERHGQRPIVVLENVPELREEIQPLDPGFPIGRPIVLYQGGIYAHNRAFRESIRALTFLDDVVLVILGFGRDDDLNLIRQWAHEEGVADRVHLLPPRPFDELVRTAAAATVGIVPIRAIDLGTYTGDTNKLFEYLMAGLPVAASNLPEIRRVLTAGDPPPGELFDAEDPESIALAIGRLLADKDLYAARRREARRLALEHYNWNVQEPRLLEIYREVLTNAPHRRRTKNHPL